MHVAPSHDSRLTTQKSGGAAAVRRLAGRAGPYRKSPSTSQMTVPSVMTYRRSAGRLGDPIGMKAEKISEVMAEYRSSRNF